MMLSALLVAATLTSQCSGGVCYGGGCYGGGCSSWGYSGDTFYSGNGGYFQPVMPSPPYATQLPVYPGKYTIDTWKYDRIKAFLESPGIAEHWQRYKQAHGDGQYQQYPPPVAPQPRPSLPPVPPVPPVSDPGIPEVESGTLKDTQTVPLKPSETKTKAKKKGIVAKQVANGRMVLPDGRVVDAREVQMPTRAPTQRDAQCIGWCTINPVRPGFYDPRLGKVLSDIESQLPAGHIYRDNDLHTWAHEATHGINSRVRMALAEGYNAFYCLNGSVGVFRTPKLPKSYVNAFVPAHLRGDVWDLYMVGSVAADWEHNSLYILDEWVAYINGATCGRELKRMGTFTADRSYKKDLDHVIEMAGYASALLQAIARFDPQYADYEKLCDFVGFNIQRTFALLSEEQRQQALAFVRYFVTPGTKGITTYCKPHGWTWINNAKWARIVEGG